MKRIATFVLCLLLVACAPSAETIQTAIAQTASAWTPIPSQTAYPTLTAPPTVYVTKIVIVTFTYTPTPLYTPTVTSTPLPPTSTPDTSRTSTAEVFARLIADKKDGFYLVNVDIAPGVWRSTGTGDGCYWEITSLTGDIIDNHFGMSGGTAYIPASAFQIEFSDCGTWIYLSPP